MKGAPSLRKTFIWMAVLGLIAVWCLVATVASIFTQPDEVPGGVMSTLLFGGLFLIPYRTHMKRIEQRKRWRDERLKAWIHKPLPAVPSQTDWAHFEREADRMARYQQKR
jgi:hypothetical protein